MSQLKMLNELLYIVAIMEYDLIDE